MSPLDVALESYQDRRVLITGDTGFKGGWLAGWLARAGAEVHGYALSRTEPSLYSALRLQERIRHHEGDVRDRARFESVWREASPEVVFHLAAQSLVTQSYRDPIETIETNVLGVSHALELARCSSSRLALVIITSDKCYENVETYYGYRETDRLGGHDPYSASKACAEILASAYRSSFFRADGSEAGLVSLATARAGNVVGGGDWAPDRLVPDCIRSLHAGETIRVRNPAAVRPWQHVLEPLSGYLMLGAHLLGASTEERGRFCTAWNFGPRPGSAPPVREIVELAIRFWGAGRWEEVESSGDAHESGLLMLAIDKAMSELDWAPCWDAKQTIEETVRWYLAYYHGEEMVSWSERQIDRYLEAWRG